MATDPTPAKADDARSAFAKYLTGRLDKADEASRQLRGMIADARHDAVLRLDVLAAGLTNVAAALDIMNTRTTGLADRIHDLGAKVDALLETLLAAAQHRTTAPAAAVVLPGGEAVTPPAPLTIVAATDEAAGPSPDRDPMGHALASMDTPADGIPLDAIDYEAPPITTPAAIASDDAFGAALGAIDRGAA